MTHKEAQRMVENIEPGQLYLYSVESMSMYVLITSINYHAWQDLGPLRYKSWAAQTCVEAYITYISGKHWHSDRRNRIVEDYLINTNAFLGDYLKRIA